MIKVFKYLLHPMGMLASLYSIRFAKSLPARMGAVLLDTLLFPLSRSAPKKLSAIKKILIIRKDEIGDMLISIPMYPALRKAFPQAEIIVLSGKPSAQVLKNNPHIDSVLEIETIRSSKLNFVKEYFRQISAIKKMKIDLALDPKGSLLNIVLMWLAGIRYRVSYWNVSGGKHLLTHPITYNKQMPEAEADLHMLRELGIKAKYSLPQLYLSAADKKEVSTIIKSLPKGYIGVYMTPSMPYKSWADEKWNALFKRMQNEKFVIVCREQEKEQLRKFEAGNKNVSLLSVNNLRVLSGILSAAKAIVAVDGGIMHLAWIANPNVVALFGQNDVTLWGPRLGTTITHLPQELQGLGRERIDFQKPNKYMDMITVDEVEKALRNYL